jgi:quinohemoprotein ethanol dehydrogenase
VEILMNKQRTVASALALAIGWAANVFAAESQMPPSANWLRYGLDSNETRHSPLAQINAKNVSELGLAWSAELTSESGVLEGTPLEVDGRLYVNGGVGAVYAFESTTGRPLWSYDPKANEADPRGTRIIYGSDRGLAYWKGNVYTATKDGRLVALDARSGRVVWTTKFLLPKTNTLSTGAPRVIDGKIIVGTAGSEFAGRGSVTAVDAVTGKTSWRFFTVPGNPANGFEDATQAMAAKTWSGEWWKYGGGGAAWNAMTYDEELGRVYIGTGNAGPWVDKVRAKPGDDNLFSSSIVALDARTGHYLWHYQTTPNDVWDFDSTADITLATLPVEGKPRKVLLQANKNGFFYVIDRVNGHLISADKYSTANWASHIDLKTGRPVEIPGSRYADRRTIIAPSVVGAHDWQSMSYNANTGLAYFPGIRAVTIFSPSKEAFNQLAQTEGRLLSVQGVDAVVRTENSHAPSGELIAWDPLRHKAVWRVPLPSEFNGGTLTTDGNLVFQGLTNGKFIAYSADHGEQLWSFDAHMGIMAAPMTFSVDGTQYVAVLAGYGGGAGEGASLGYEGWAWGMPRRLLTFRLGATAQLPSAPQPIKHITPLDDSDLKLDTTKIAAGNNLYGQVCTGCHGEAVVGNGTAPDLRASPVAFNRAAMHRVLSEGLLVSKGMPRFDDLSDSEIDSLYEFVRSRAREDLKAGRDGLEAVLATDPN